MSVKIFKGVKSPFTDDLIQELIKKYISCGCNDNLLYNEINHLENNKNSIDPYTSALINNIYCQGINKNMLWNCKKENDSQLIYDNNTSWVIIYSEEDPMKDNQFTADNKIPLIYRFYLNLKGKEKSDFVLNYLNKCRERKLPYEFKFSKDDYRNDQIIVLSRLENFEENISIIEDLTKDIQLGKLPMLVGEYKNNIGIDEEYYNRLYSPTKAKLSLVRSSVKKYLCDHKDDFYDILSDVEKEKLDEYISEFTYLYTNELEDKEELGEDYEDLNKKYYQIKNSIECAKEYIENDSNAYFCGTGLLDLNGAIQQIYSNNPEQFVSEIIKNYRLIGTQVWGFSQNFVFLNETEEKFLKSKENQITLSSEEISSELEILSRESLVEKVQADLIAIAEKKELREIENEIEK